MFSSRLPADLATTPLARAMENARLSRDVIDLTETNPTRAGFAYPDLRRVFAGIDWIAYEPDPRGLASARQAIAADYARRGISLDADRILLTASSSESYAYLFKVLCDPDDAVLVPVPSYPLFDHLAGLEGIRLVSYRLEYHDRWQFDFDELEARLGDRVRAVLVVSPNNPTGSMLRDDDLNRLAALCAEREMALIGDEVFADFPIDAPSEASSSVIQQETALAVSLGGLSKSAGLPHLKLGWMALGGPGPLVASLRDRLELVADTYLSVASPVQRATPELLQLAPSVREQILGRVTQNMRMLQRLASRYPACQVLPVEGGWSAVVRIPATRSDEDWVLTLAQQAHVIVYPGFFFDFDRDGYLVVSLLVTPADFERGIARVFETIDRG
jgi:aspartate/methionine/tyrosine aminotransferase